MIRLKQPITTDSTKTRDSRESVVFSANHQSLSFECVASLSEHFFVVERYFIPENEVELVPEQRIQLGCVSRDLSQTNVDRTTLDNLDMSIDEPLETSEVVTLYVRLASRTMRQIVEVLTDLPQRITKAVTVSSRNETGHLS
eukprot:c14193_g1_i1.p4 GENE.c14193_g1_i1~~c14193_g1_i1.p4  ORF type:complete len:142 (-),score=22.79 c14193_g1_i1:266-691(-)